MKVNWIIDIMPDAPEGFRSCSVVKTEEDKLLVSLFCRTWDELPDLRRQLRFSVLGT
jgi:hypothetical protein